MFIRTTEQQTEHILGLLHTETVRRRERRKRALRITASLASFVIVCSGVWSFFGYYGNLMQKKNVYSGDAVQDGSYGDETDANIGAPIGNGVTESPGFDCNSPSDFDMTEPSDGVEEEWNETSCAAVCEGVYLRKLLGEYDKLPETMPLFEAEVNKIRLTTHGSVSMLTFCIRKNFLQAPEGGLSEYLGLLRECSTLTVTRLPYAVSPEEGLKSAVTASVEKMTVSEENGEILLTVQLEKAVFSEGRPLFFFLAFGNAETPEEKLFDCVGGWCLPENSE